MRSVLNKSGEKKKYRLITSIIGAQNAKVTHLNLSLHLPVTRERPRKMILCANIGLNCHFNAPINILRCFHEHSKQIYLIEKNSKHNLETILLEPLSHLYPP